MYGIGVDMSEQWKRVEYKTPADTVLTVMNTGDSVEFEIEDTQFTDELVWVYLTHEQVTDLIVQLQNIMTQRGRK
jgi:hypothetical protein